MNPIRRTDRIIARANQRANRRFAAAVEAHAWANPTSALVRRYYENELLIDRLRISVGREPLPGIEVVEFALANAAGITEDELRAAYGMGYQSKLDEYQTRGA